MDDEEEKVADTAEDTQDLENVDTSDFNASENDFTPPKEEEFFVPKAYTGNQKVDTALTNLASEKGLTDKEVQEIVSSMSELKKDNAGLQQQKATQVKEWVAEQQNHKELQGDDNAENRKQTLRFASIGLSKINPKLKETLKSAGLLNNPEVILDLAERGKSTMDAGKMPDVGSNSGGSSKGKLVSEMTQAEYNAEMKF